ncbi:MAG TPA: hypothetical protein VE710_18240 [Candidatus Bathyarchaeia archaeon]|nr:hypothetical protein [Candidatus Bathyarchaeia archaeon]
MELQYLGKTCEFVDFARSTVLPEEFLVLRCGDEILVAPTHDLSGLKYGGVDLEKVKKLYESKFSRQKVRSEKFKNRVLCKASG